MPFHTLLSPGYLGAVSDQKMLETDTSFFRHLHDGHDVMADKGYRHMVNFFAMKRRGIRYRRENMLFNIFLSYMFHRFHTSLLHFQAHFSSGRGTANDDSRTGRADKKDCG